MTGKREAIADDLSIRLKLCNRFDGAGKLAIQASRIANIGHALLDDAVQLLPIIADPQVARRMPRSGFPHPPCASRKQKVIISRSCSFRPPRV